MTTPDDGRHDFDFIHGAWRIDNRKLHDMTDPDCATWQHFATTSRARPVFGGLSHVEHIVAGPEAPGGAWEGLTLRQFDPAERTWRIWWASSRNPGRLDPPLAGSFRDGVGEFTGRDVLAGRPIDVRVRWTTPAPDTAVWRQEFSYDGGNAWFLTWVMTFHRVAAADSNDSDDSDDSADSDDSDDSDDSEMMS